VTSTITLVLLQLPRLAAYVLIVCIAFACVPASGFQVAQGVLLGAALLAVLLEGIGGRRLQSELFEHLTEIALKEGPLLLKRKESLAELRDALTKVRQDAHAGGAANPDLTNLCTALEKALAEVEISNPARDELIKNAQSL